MAALLSLPAGLAYGVLIFGTLGPEAATRGVMVGLTTMIFLNLVSSLRPGCLTLISSPTSLPTLVMSAAVSSLSASGLYSNDQIFLIVFIAIAFAGVLQIGIGLTGLGELAKFIPFPVRSGLLTGTGLLMLKSQIPNILGLERGEPLSGAKWGAVLVFAITILFIYLSGKISKKLPSVIIGLIAGSLAYAGIAHFAGAGVLGIPLDEIPFSLPSPAPGLDAISFFMSSPLQLLQVAGVLAIGIALVASMETLVSVIATDNLSGKRSNTIRELTGQGLGNIACALFGGIAGAGSPSRSVLCYNYGARSPLSRIAAGLFALSVVIGIGPQISIIPMGALAGVLTVLAFKLLDAWIPKTFCQIFRQTKGISIPLTNLSISFCVVFMMLVVGIFEAIATGLFLSLVYFVARMGRRVVRREYDASSVHSTVFRTEEESTVLRTHGNRIKILEIEGSLFFGTADSLSRTIERICEEDTDSIIVDLQLVAELDMTGAMIFPSIMRTCRENDASLILSYKPDTAVAYHLKTLGVLDIVGQDACFTSISEALEQAEERLLDHVLRPNRYETEHDLLMFPALSDLGSSELNTLLTLLLRHELKPGEILFKQHQVSSSLYFVVQGQMRVLAERQNQTPLVLATIGPTMLLGELALVDDHPRSATVRAAGVAILYELPKESFLSFLQRDPSIAGKIYSGIAREIANRMRFAISTVL